MKTKNLKKVAFSIVACAALFSTSCKKENILEEKVQADGKVAGLDLGTNDPQLDVAKFAKGIETYLNGRVAGYGYTIFHKGELFFLGNGGGGWARKKSDPPAIAHNAYEKQGAASVTKFVTALAIVAALEKYDLSLDEKLYKYLPTNWKPSAEFKKLSFKRLLAHETGLIKNGGEFSEYKLTVEGPIKQAEFKDSLRVYNNINYGLAAILLPYISARNGFPQDNAVLKGLENNPKELYKQLGIRFINQTRLFVFKPAQLIEWQYMNWCVWSGYGVRDASEGTLGYTTVNGLEKGSEKEDLRENGGAGGLYLSPWAMAMIQVYAADGKIVSKTNYKRMKEQRLGFDGIYYGDHGKYYWKNGGANRHETIIADFGPTQVAVFTNSQTSDIGNGLGVLGAAYDAAWVKK